MFTGIIEEMGRVEEIKRGSHSAVLAISASKILLDVKMGDSIAVNGVCLTVISWDDKKFLADVMHETLKRSSLGMLQIGNKVNLERAMKVDDRFGGHIVSGHIDGSGIITKIIKDDNAVWYTIETKEKLKRYMIEKGSIAIDGISLTIAEVLQNGFRVSVIPHTQANTTLLYKKQGEVVNLEADCIGKYVYQFMREKDGGIDRGFLARHGFL